MTFTKKCRDTDAYNNEKFAYSIFKDKSWCPNLISCNDDKNEIVIDFYQGKDLVHINKNDKDIILYNLLIAIYDIFSEGYCHCDLHIGNVLILNDNTIKIIDFESIRKANINNFFESQDVIGKSFTMPPGNGNMCIMKNHEKSISTFFGIKSIEKLKYLMKDIINK